MNIDVDFIGLAIFKTRFSFSQGSLTSELKYKLLDKENRFRLEYYKCFVSIELPKANLPVMLYMGEYTNKKTVDSIVKLCSDETTEKAILNVLNEMKGNNSKTIIEKVISRLRLTYFDGSTVPVKVLTVDEYFNKGYFLIRKPKGGFKRIY